MRQIGIFPINPKQQHKAGARRFHRFDAPVVPAPAVFWRNQAPITRGDGSYRITIRPGRYEVRARLIGYGLARDTVTVAAGGTATQNFRLGRSASALDAVAVVGTRSQPRSSVESPVPTELMAVLQKHGLSLPAALNRGEAAATRPSP